MQIIAQCPECGASWLLDSAAADRRIKCHNCSRKFKVPGVDEMGKAVEIINESESSLYVDKSGKIYG